LLRYGPPFPSIFPFGYFSSRCSSPWFPPPPSIFPFASSFFGSPLPPPASWADLLFLKYLSFPLFCLFGFLSSGPASGMSKIFGFRSHQVLRVAPRFPPEVLSGRFSTLFSFQLLESFCASFSVMAWRPGVLPFFLFFLFFFFTFLAAWCRLTLSLFFSFVSSVRELPWGHNPFLFFFNSLIGGWCPQWSDCRSPSLFSNFSVSDPPSCVDTRIVSFSPPIPALCPVLRIFFLCTFLKEFIS